jgi:predicted ATPase
MRYDTDYVSTLAEGLAGAGRLDEALDTIERALARCDRDGVRWSIAELLRIKAELLLLSSDRESANAAEACFVAALDEARRQGAALWEIRIALGLARLKTRQGRPDDAQRIVAPVYHRFTEGFDTADLRAVRALLDALPTV